MGFSSKIAKYTKNRGNIDHINNYYFYDQKYYDNE